MEPLHLVLVVWTLHHIIVGLLMAAGEGATALAALLNLAYSTLSDPDSRAAYDLELRTYRR
jgi:hypothetical protein